MLNQRELLSEISVARDQSFCMKFLTLTQGEIL